MDTPDKNSNLLSRAISQNGIPKLLLGVFLIICIWLIEYSFTHFGMIAGLAVGFAPLLLCGFYYCLKQPAYALMGMLVVNYFLMYLSRMTFGKLPIGAILDGMILLNILVLLLHAFANKVSWGRAKSGLTLVAVIWTLYCVLELFNPSSVSSKGWISSVRSVAFDFLIIVVLTQIIVDDFKYVKQILFVWSVLTLIAVAKALVQKYIGFSQTERIWLYVYGGALTHILSTSVRYFSIYSDAANFGAGMGMAMVVFSIVGFYSKNRILSIYYIAVSLLACYGMLISGTRSALAVPFGGYAILVLMSRKPKIIILASGAMLGAFLFLNYTHIGQGNAIIRRARSAFNRNDPSLQVRLANQAKLKVLLADKPFGYGIGNGGGKAKEYAPDSPVSQIATDSWFVMMWVETGIVGLTLHIAILLYVIFYGCYLVLFKIRSPQVKGVTLAFISGIFGIAAMSYANEVFGQIPNGLFVYMCMGLIFVAPYFDKQMSVKTIDNPQ